MKPYKDFCAPCEQNQDQLRSAISEGDKDLLMKDWLAHISSSKCVRLLYNIWVLSPKNRDAVWAAFGLKSFEVLHNEVVHNEVVHNEVEHNENSCISGDKYFTFHL